MKMERLARIMEFFWLALGIGGTLWTAWQIHAIGWAGAKVYTWFPLICFAMFFYRRFTRKKMAEWAARRAREQEGGGRQ